MPRTVDHIVETHRIARTRREAGQPIWAHHFDVSDVFHNEALTFEQRRDHIVTGYGPARGTGTARRCRSSPTSWPTARTVTSSTGRGMACTTKPTTTACGSKPFRKEDTTAQ